MKKRMKRLLAMGIGLMLLLGGCAGKEDVIITEVPEMGVEEVPVVEEEVEEAVEEVLPLKVNISTNHKNYYFEDSETSYLYLQYCDVAVSGDGYDSLKRNLEKWSVERSEGLRSLYASFEELVSADSTDEDDFSGYRLYHTLSTARVDDGIVSLVEDTNQYTGGENNSFYREGITFDTQSGKRLGLRDILTDYDNFSIEAIERIIYELKDISEEMLFSDYITVIEQLWQSETGPQWYIDATGIVIVLQESSVGDKILGALEFHFPYAEFEPYIEEAYLLNDSNGVAAVEQNQEVFFKLPKTGEEISLMLSWEQDEQTSEGSLWLGDQEMPLKEYVMIESAYLVKTEDDIYCMVTVDRASDDYETTIYRLSDGVIEKVTEITAAVDQGNVNSDEILMESWVYMLGTYGGVKNYYFDDNGRFVTDDTEFLLHRNEYVLTTTKSLPVTLDNVESILPAGSHIVLNATDDETCVTFTIQETGQVGTLQVSRDENNYDHIVIDGMNENECFEILPYAG